MIPSIILKYLECASLIVTEDSIAERCYLQKQPPKVFLEILQNSQENTYVRVSF